MFLASQTDWAAILTAVGGIVTAIGWAVAQFRNGHKIKEVHQSVGTTNGVDLVGLVQQVGTLETYTHEAIHDLKAMLAPVAALAPTDPELLNAAVANKREERADAAKAGGRRSDDPPPPDRPLHAP